MEISEIVKEKNKEKRLKLLDIHINNFYADRNDCFRCKENNYGREWWEEK